uniref:Uncharacterized protein n=1 Tax=Tanacetum cinerariifolium TaxID=118510 RepID=A0A6L2M9G7_TANCI|nr:hypothetical protein [Tanacetum cinerariifolium]
MIAILEKYEHNVDFHQIVDFVEASYIRQYSRRAKITQSTTLPTAADEPASLLRDDSQREAFPTVSGLEARQDRENIIKTSALPYDSTPRVTSLTVDEGTQDLEIYSLKARIKLLEDKDGGGAEPSGEDATIKGRSLETWEEAGVEKSTERGSNDTEELVNVLTSLDAANILTSGVQVVSVPSAAEVSTVGIPTSSGLVPTASPIFTTTSVVTPYSRRKAREMEEQMVREDQRRNEQIARDAEIEYEQFVADFSIGEKIDMINELVKYQDHYAKVLKYQSQQSKPLSKKQQREFYMSILKSHSGWKTKNFKEEGERMKRKGLRLEQESAKKIKTSEEVSEEDLKEMMQLVPVEKVYIEALQVKHPIIDWEIHSEGQRNYWKIIRLGGSTAVYQFFVDMLKHFDREDLIQLWTLMKETVSIRQSTSNKEKELWVELKRLFELDFEDQLWIQTQALMHDPVEWRLYDTCGVHHVLTRYQEIFMLVEKDYPLRKGLAIVMISNKLQVENYSQMANDLILKIHNIANSPRQRDD